MAAGPPPTANGQGARVPPHNLDAERALLGAMLLTSAAIAEAVEATSVEDFYRPAHRHVFAAIVALWGAGEAVDTVTVADELQRLGLLDAVGGPSALVEMQANTPVAGNADRYAAIVARCADFRLLLGAASEVVEMAYSQPGDVEEALDAAEALISRAGRQAPASETWRERLTTHAERVEALRRGEETPSQPTGLTDLDLLLAGGLQDGHLVVLGGRPAVGKTSLALRIAANVARAGRPALVASLEMSGDEVTTRMVSIEGRLPGRALLTGALDDEAHERWAKTREELEDLPIIIEEDLSGVLDIRARARRRAAEPGGLGLVVVDYLQLLPSRGRAESRQQEVADASRDLKLLARDLRCPVLALSQLNRGVEARGDRRPLLCLPGLARRRQAGLRGITPEPTMSPSLTCTYSGPASAPGCSILRGSRCVIIRGARRCSSHGRASAACARRRSTRASGANSRGMVPFAGRQRVNLAREVTGLPLVGMTLATGDNTWSARHWDIGVGTQVDCTPATNVRVIGHRLAVSWNDALACPPHPTSRQVRTVSAWGDRCQADLARRRVLVVGAGSVGLDIIVRLAASGLCSLTVMVFDIVEDHNLDRLIGATPRDAHLLRPKTHVARRLVAGAGTAADPRIEVSNLSICEPDGLKLALDHDLIFSCVDRPWPRAVLNALAYTDLIPVIDGGIDIDTFDDGTMRNATWRTHVIRPGRACMSCNRQLDLGRVIPDKQGLLDNPDYIKGADRPARPQGQNVAPLAVSVSGGLLARYTSFGVAPAGFGDPGPLQYTLSTHGLLHRPYTTRPHCPIEPCEGAGDHRTQQTDRHPRAEQKRQQASSPGARLRLLRWIDDGAQAIGRWLDRS